MKKDGASAIVLRHKKILQKKTKKLQKKQLINYYNLSYRIISACYWKEKYEEKLS